MNSLMFRILLLVLLFCIAPHCDAAQKKIIVDGYWGRKSISYTEALKRLHFHILLPQEWRATDCVFYPQWILQDKTITGNDPGPRLPSRQAVAVALKGDSDYLVIETPYLQNFSRNDNWHGLDWIVANGYFTRAVNEPCFAGMDIGRRGDTSYAILTSDRNRPNQNRFEKSLR